MRNSKPPSHQPPRDPETPSGPEPEPQTDHKGGFLVAGCFLGLLLLVFIVEALKSR